MSVKPPISNTKKMQIDSSSKISKVCAVPNNTKSNNCFLSPKFSIDSKSKSLERSKNSPTCKDSISEIVKSCILSYIKPLQDEIQSLKKELEAHKSECRGLNNASPSIDEHASLSPDQLKSQHIRAISQKLEKSCKSKRNVQINSKGLSQGLNIEKSLRYHQRIDEECFSSTECLCRGWKDGKAYDEGRNIHVNGATYEGDWKNDRRNKWHKDANQY